MEANGLTMKFARFTAYSATLCAVVALSAQAASAAPALAINNVNMRQGPGTNYPIILTIPGGSNVNVGGCNGTWCAVAFGGQSGYAVATSFDMGGGPPSPGPDVPIPVAPGAPPPGYGEPPVYVGPPYYGPGPYYGPYRGYYRGGYDRRW